jgi:uncharacterized membrane protein YczE
MRQDAAATGAAVRRGRVVGRESMPGVGLEGAMSVHEESFGSESFGSGPPVARRFRGRRLPRRLVQLYVGLMLYGASCGLMVRADLGLGPWDVFHQGVARHTGLSIGTVSIVAGAVVLLAWVPIRQRPGLGTVSNVALVGLSMDATLWLLPELRAIAARTALVAVAVTLNAAATALYISANFGAGPRDGLMTGLHEVTGRSIRLVRTGIEITVLASGLLLGGSAGVGTVVYALGIGPLVQLFLRPFTARAPATRSSTGVVARGAARPADDHDGEESHGDREDREACAGGCPGDRI